MSHEILPLSGCSEKYAELCALSTTGELSAEESANLAEHIAKCARCATLLGEYTSLAHVGMAKLVSEMAPGGESLYPFRERKAEHRLTAALEAAQSDEELGPRTPSHASFSESPKRVNRRLIFAGAIAASFLFCVSGAF
jgi:anti-sigma factor RsiW